LTAEIVRHRTRSQFRAAVAIATLETASTRERLRLRGDEQGVREADAIETLMDAVREFLGDV
jgi:uncharacterized protein (UPF0147 family)